MDDQVILFLRQRGWLDSEIMIRGVYKYFDWLLSRDAELFEMYEKFGYK